MIISQFPFILGKTQAEYEQWLRDGRLASKEVIHVESETQDPLVLPIPEP